MQNRLKEGGFNILAVTPLDNSKDRVSIVFTDNILKELASKPKRGFASNLRIIVDKSRNRVSFLNPVIYLKGSLDKMIVDIRKARELLAKILISFSKSSKSNITI